MKKRMKPVRRFMFCNESTGELSSDSIFRLRSTARLYAMKNERIVRVEIREIQPAGGPKAKRKSRR